MQHLPGPRAGPVAARPGLRPLVGVRRSPIRTTLPDWRWAALPPRLAASQSVRRSGAPLTECPERKGHAQARIAPAPGRRYGFTRPIGRSTPVRRRIVRWLGRRSGRRRPAPIVRPRPRAPRGGRSQTSSGAVARPTSARRCPSRYPLRPGRRARADGAQEGRACAANSRRSTAAAASGTSSQNRCPRRAQPPRPACRALVAQPDRDDVVPDMDAVAVLSRYGSVRRPAAAVDRWCRWSKRRAASSRRRGSGSRSACPR